MKSVNFVNCSGKQLIHHTNAKYSVRSNFYCAVFICIQHSVSLAEFDEILVVK